MRLLLSTLLLGLLATPLAAQTARVQVIHNAPDPGAAAVDVYLDDALLLDDFAFRTASPFIDAPAGTEITIAVAPPTSTGPGDAIATFPFTLTEGETYQLIATGVLDPSMFAPNPDGASTAFTLLANTPAREASTVPTEAQFNVVHGSPDAPTVDVVARGVGTLVDDAPYTGITGYLGVPAARYVLDVTTADGATVVASYLAPLSTAGGTAFTVLASGFLDPAANQNGPAFGLLGVLPDGTTSLLPTTTARVQVIHNAPDPGAAAVDVYLNDALLLDDFAFRTASPYVDAPAEEEIVIAVAPPTSTSAADAIATFSYTLLADRAYQLIATGVLDPSQFAPNPDGASTAFTLLVNANAREGSKRPGQVQVVGVHGSPDAPTVDVVLDGFGHLVNDEAYGGITPYRTAPPADYLGSVTTADGSVVVASYTAPFADAADDAVTLLASGFLDPSANQNGPAFGLLAVSSDGSAFLLPEARRASPAPSVVAGTVFEAPRPNPARAASSLTLSVSEAQAVEVAVYDVTGRRVAVLLDRAMGAGETAALAIDASQLPAGVYVVRAQGERFAEAHRFTVVR